MRPSNSVLSVYFIFTSQRHQLSFHHRTAIAMSSIVFAEIFRATRKKSKNCLWSHSTIVWNVLSCMHFSYRKSFIDTNDGGEHIIVFRRIMCMLYLEFEKLSQKCSTMSFHPTPEVEYYLYKYARWQSSLHSKQQRKKCSKTFTLSLIIITFFWSLFIPYGARCSPCVWRWLVLFHTRQRATYSVKNCFKYPRKIQFFSHSCELMASRVCHEGNNREFSNLFYVWGRHCAARLS